MKRKYETLKITIKETELNDVVRTSTVLANDEKDMVKDSYETKWWTF